MKKTLLLCLLCLILGGCAGLMLNVGGLDGRGLLAGERPASTTPGVAAAALLPAAPPSETLDPTDNAPLLEAGEAALAALKAGDVEALAALTHPDRGVTFTPYSTVDPDHNLTFLPDQLSQAGSSNTPYVWGYTQGKGDPISLTLPEFLRQYVFRADYTRAPVIGVDHVNASGNALENVAEAYPGDRFLEYYIPGAEPENGGMDWSALKLVFAELDGAYKLVGIIHSEWTI